MEFNSWILKNKMKLKWHSAMLYYYLSLHDSCLDSAINGQLMKKISYHRENVNKSLHQGAY
jgi:hypothetical protein